ncbi:MAG: peptidoglycan DD-metalloendopeptidase family protein [Gemmatimonadales bacterium]
MRYQFTFEVRGIEPVASATIDVQPRDAKPATRLTLPVDGPAIVYDGHDFYSHHRRIPLGGELARRFNLTTNPVRFANDWSPVGPDGELARGSLSVPTNWYAYGAVVRAPGPGLVISVANDVPDNRIEGGDSLVVPPEVAANPERAWLGNHLIIAHGEGEYSVLAHLEMGSVPVRVGDSVRAGAPVGRIGFSGDTGFHVHLHHVLVTDPGMSGEGLPTYFDQVRRVAMGGGAKPFGPVLSAARLDTGDLVVRVP